MIKPDKPLWMLLITILLMDILAGMEFDLFVPSFPSLQSQFHLSTSLVELLLSLNFLGVSLSLFITGYLGDRYSRKNIIISGLLLFILGSFLCLAGNQYSLLLIGRFIQGIGIAAPIVLSFLIIADYYPLKKQQFLMSMLNGVVNVSVAISPVIGSYITLYFHWQGNFISLLILGIFTLLMTLLFIPNTAAVSHRASFFKGYLSLFQIKPLFLLIINIILMFIPYWIFVGISPLLYIKDLKVSLSYFGYYQGIFALIFAVGSVIFGIMIHHFRQQTLIKIPIFIYWLSFLCVSSIALFNPSHPMIITIAFIPFIISQIIPSNMLVPLCLNMVPHSKGQISAILQAGRLIFSSLCLQLTGYFYDGTFRNIGIILSVVILCIIITHAWIAKNKSILLLLKE